MKRLILMMGLLLILIVPQAWGQTTTKYPDPNRLTTWNNITDSVHTWGQKPPQAKLTKMKLRHTRAVNRLQGIRKSRKAHMTAWQNSQNSGQ